ncbi:MAG: hypothetical protein JRF05_08970 [Deltaproteobacteria bacterium]|jgi:hypothetical protein|nr:hypothetical protein [Deltaproteobacteria bacterium]
MDFEQILPFIMLLIFWGASSILRKIGKTDQEKQAPAHQKPVLVKILQQLAAFKEKGKDEELVEYDEYLKPSPPPRADEHEKESLIDMAQDSLQQVPAVTGWETVSVSPPTGVTKPRPTILRRKPMAMMNRRKLQNAVIWAEILASPVALRDQYLSRRHQRK